MSFPVFLTFDMDVESTVLAIDPANARRPGVLSVGQCRFIAFARSLGAAVEFRRCGESARAFQVSHLIGGN